MRWAVRMICVSGATLVRWNVSRSLSGAAKLSACSASSVPLAPEVGSRGTDWPDWTGLPDWAGGCGTLFLASALGFLDLLPCPCCLFPSLTALPAPWLVPWQPFLYNSLLAVPARSGHTLHPPPSSPPCPQQSVQQSIPHLQDFCKDPAHPVPAAYTLLPVARSP